MTKSFSYSKRRKIYRYWTYNSNTKIACWHATHKPPCKKVIKHGNFEITKIIYSKNNLKYDKITSILRRRDSLQLHRTLSTYGDLKPRIELQQEFKIYNSENVLIGVDIVKPENAEIVCIAGNKKVSYPLNTCCLFLF